MGQYAMGIDVGSLSARAIVLDLKTGQIVSQAVSDFAHGVMTDSLPDGTPLGPGWALQVPGDYLEALYEAAGAAMAGAGIAPGQVVGVGLDATSCTILPVTAEGVPLCWLERFAGHPHAYAKLWKHHAAESWAAKLQRLAEREDPTWFRQSGRNISGEHFLPKAAQFAAEAPEVYAAADRLLEAGDWLVWQLCGRESRNTCAAGFKTYYRSENGEVSPELLRRVHPLLGELEKKYPAPLLRPGDRAGGLTEAAAKRMGLNPGTPVSAAAIDAHVTLLGCRITEPGELLMVIGTSACEILLDRECREVPGISGVVREGILPGLYVYEGGQACVGDLVAWFFAHMIPASCEEEARRRGMEIHALLEEKAAACPPGGNGLVALDWWNGVRSTHMDFDLSGLIVGLTMTSRPEEIYRALLESLAFGARRIVRALEEQGLNIRRIYAAGGIPRKNALMMQIYADACGVDVYVPEQEQSGAVGSALLGAAAGTVGFRGLPELLRALPKPECRVYRPRKEYAQAYRELYRIYSELYEYFGKSSDAMHRLKTLRSLRGGPGQ